MDLIVVRVFAGLFCVIAALATAILAVARPLWLFWQHGMWSADVIPTFWKMVIVSICFTSAAAILLRHRSA